MQENLSVVKMTTIENLQIKLLQIQKDLKKLLTTTKYAISDLNKLNTTPEGVSAKAHCKEVENE